MQRDTERKRDLGGSQTGDVAILAPKQLNSTNLAILSLLAPNFCSPDAVTASLVGKLAGSVELFPVELSLLYRTFADSIAGEVTVAARLRYLGQGSCKRQKGPWISLIRVYLGPSLF